MPILMNFCLYFCEGGRARAEGWKTCDACSTGSKRRTKNFNANQTAAGEIANNIILLFINILCIIPQVLYWL
jgi:hypothetical protein